MVLRLTPLFTSILIFSAVFYTTNAPTSSVINIVNREISSINIDLLDQNQVRKRVSQLEKQGKGEDAQKLWSAHIAAVKKLNLNLKM